MCARMSRSRSMPGAISISSSPCDVSAEDAPLGDVEDGLAARGGVAAAEGDLPHCFDELAGPALLHDPKPPSSIATWRPPAVKVPVKTTALAFWLMLMKPPAPASLPPNRLTLTLPSASHSRHAEDGEVEAAAVVEVELLVLVDHRVGVDGRAEVEARGRNPADHAGLGGQRDVAQDLLLVGHRGHAFGHADAEVDHAVGRQLHRRRAER